MEDERILILEDTKLVLEERGWCKASFISLSGECCIVGAVMQAEDHYGYDWSDTVQISDDDSALLKMHRSIMDALRANIPKKDKVNNSAMSYNDLPETTEKDIFKLIDNTIKGLKA